MYLIMVDGKPQKFYANGIDRGLLTYEAEGVDLDEATMMSNKKVALAMAARLGLSDDDVKECAYILLGGDLPLKFVVRRVSSHGMIYDAQHVNNIESATLFHSEADADNMIMTSSFPYVDDWKIQIVLLDEQG